MDWKQFIASLVGSLAWPAAFLIFLFVIRKYLGGLVARVIELHLPGGAKAVFVAQLERGQEVIEITKSERKNPTMAFDEMPKELSEKPEIKIYRPHYMILSAYDSVSDLLKQVRAAMDLSERMNLPSIMRALEEKRLVDSDMVRLFDSARAARNAALHASQSEISRVEAEEYVKQVSVLSTALRAALNEIKKK